MFIANTAFRTRLCDFAVKTFALIAGALLLAMLLPAAAYADTTWAEAKTQQLLEAYENAAAAREDAEIAAATAEAVAELAHQNAENAQREATSCEILRSNYESAQRALSTAIDTGDENQIAAAQEALDQVKQDIASAMGCSVEELDDPDITAALIRERANDAQAAAQKASEDSEAAQQTYQNALDDLSDKQKEEDAAKKAYEDYIALPDCTISFDLAGGTLDGKTGTITNVAKPGDVVNLPDAPTREGFTFKCWKGSEYAAGAEYVVPEEEEHNFTAAWEENKEPEESLPPAIPATGDATRGMTAVAFAAAALAFAALGVSAFRRRDA